MSKRTFYRASDAHPYPIPVQLDEDPNDGRHFEDLAEAWDALDREAKAWIGLASGGLKRCEEERQKLLADLARAAEFATAVFCNRERSEG